METILVVGGDSTIGQSIATCCLSDYCVSVTTKTGKYSNNGTKNVYKLDVLSDHDAEVFFNNINAEGKTFNHILFSYGVGLLKPFQAVDSDEINKLIDINLKSHITLTEKFLKNIVKLKISTLTYITSITGSMVLPGMSVYSSTKAGLDHFIRHLSLELRTRKIRVNGIAPGIIESPLVEAMFSRLSENQIEEIRSKHLGGFGKAEYIAELYKFLVSNSCPWITGAIIPVDGGYHLQ